MGRMDALNSRSSRLSTNASLGRVNHPLTVRIAALYSEIWTLLAASRFCLFFAVSFFIYQSKPSAWGFSSETTAGRYGSRAGSEAASGLDQLKNRVVFTYGFMEMMFWLWVSLLHCLLFSMLFSYLSNIVISSAADPSYTPRRAARSGSPPRSRSSYRTRADLTRGDLTSQASVQYALF